MQHIRRGIAFATVAAAIAVGGCGGGGGGGLVPAGPTDRGGGGVSGVQAAPTPTPTPTPGPLTLSTTSMQFTAVGQAQSVTITEPGFYGSFAVASASGHSCQNVVAASASTFPGPDSTIAITATGAGNCVLQFNDAYAQRVYLTIYVTTTTGTVT